MSEVERIAVEFFGRWAISFDELCASFEDVMAPTCRWEQGAIITNTRAEALRFLRLSRRTIRLATIEVELPYVASVGPVVLTERVDHILRRDGTVIASAQVAGVLEFEGDHIVAWREHFDSVALAAQIPLNTLRRRPRR